MKIRGRANVDHDSGGFGGSPYTCPDCLWGIDPASTTIESGVVRGACAECGRTISFADRSASVELAGRWAIDPVDGSASPRHEAVPPLETVASEDCC